MNDKPSNITGTPADCPYYRGVGTCMGGSMNCGIHGEPRCITDEPEGGWSSERPEGEATERTTTMADQSTEDFQDRGDVLRRRYGIDGTAGDAQDIEHPYIPAEPHEHCLLCGLAPVYRKHVAMGADHG